ncbi:unnamed protein product [Arabidopsis thaliana]|uniref:(thale cress) hypothetical protein n=1 Tax=Arabidopsis thaliana TaxID=3702 RepID=A0A7G2EW93_ARATH|nr:unnamed protein product [Arabidopsis thaliana]
MKGLDSHSGVSEAILSGVGEACEDMLCAHCRYGKTFKTSI